MLSVVGLFVWAASVGTDAACPHPPKVEFAAAEPEKRVYEPGEQIIYACQPGYVQRSGQRTMICPISGEWNKPTLKCAARSCPYPGNLENGFIEHTSLTYLNWIQFSCNIGYYLNGSEASQCTETGLWSDTLPVCDPVICPPPPIPEFGKLEISNTRPKNIYQFQDAVHYECLEKYALFGNDSATCGADGNWSSIPRCIAACQISPKRGVVLYFGRKVKLQDMKPRMIRHTEQLTFYCKDKKNDCAYTVTTQCIDGVMTVPSCFHEPSRLNFFYTHPSDMKPCTGA
ncbi:beta-2-glycoprotein 1 isoform X2 [Lissotriton helveticus]